MKKTIITLALLFLAFGCQLGDPRLSGSFISDKIATIDYLESTGKYTPEQLEKLATIFGKLTVKYDGNTCVANLNQWAETNKFKIIKNEKDYLVAVESSPFDSSMVTSRIEFVENGYWLSTSTMQPCYKEKFIRK